MTTGQQRKTNILIIFTKTDIHNKKGSLRTSLFLLFCAQNKM